MMFIYGLSDPITKELRYIGFTSSGLKRRLQLHKTEAVSQNKLTHKNNWLKKLYKNNLEPEIFEIQETNQERWQEDERWNIEYFRAIGCRLTNTCLGGEGNTSPYRTEEMKKKVSLKLKGRVFSDKHRERLSLAQIGNKKNLGKHPSEEARKKMIAWQVGTKHSSERIEKNRISQGGLKDSEIKDMLYKYFELNYTRKQLAQIFNKQEISIKNFIKRQRKNFGYGDRKKNG